MWYTYISLSLMKGYENELEIKWERERERINKTESVIYWYKRMIFKYRDLYIIYTVWPVSYGLTQV